MKPGILTEIQYAKSEDDVSIRPIIPTNVPGTFVDALDTSELTTEQRDELVTAYADYQMYVKEQLSKIDKFEQFLESSNTPLDNSVIKYRRFSLNKLREL